MIPRILSQTLRNRSAFQAIPHRSAFASSLVASRGYAWSRYPERNSRFRTNLNPERQSKRFDSQPEPEILHQNELLMDKNPDAGGLERILANDTLYVTRQVEMMNIFMGFEVANRYALNDPQGNVVGYIAEEDQGFLGTLRRQVFRTHRPFRSVIMDATGTPVLWINRPFTWINSRLYVQRKMDQSLISEQSGDPSDLKLVPFGEVKQQWHPWRRKYHLFLGRDENEFVQFGQIDSGFLAWNFFLQNEGDVNIGSIRKGFTGFGREIFTDTSQYTIQFKSDPEAPSNNVAGEQNTEVYTPLSLEERAIVLALSVSIDFDYFSRHSEGGSALPFFWIFAASTE